MPSNHFLLFCAFLWQTFDLICVAPRARCRDAVLDFVSEATLVEIEQVVQCDFGFYLANSDRSSEFTGCTALDSGVVGGDARQNLLVSVVGCGFEDAEEVSD